MSTPLNYNQTPQLLLLELINYDNDTELTLDMVSLSLPVPVIMVGANTQVTLTALDQSSLNDTQNVFYRRIDLAALGPLEILTENTVTHEALVGIINAKRPTYLLANDCRPITITPNFSLGELRKLSLVANPSSLRWIGSIEIDVCFGLPSNINLLDQLLHVTLPAEGYLNIATQ